MDSGGKFVDMRNGVAIRECHIIEGTVVSTGPPISRNLLRDTEEGRGPTAG